MNDMLQVISGLLMILSLFSPLEAKKTAKSEPEVAYSTPSRAPSRGRGHDVSSPFVEAAKIATPCVVYIEAEGTADTGQDPFDFFNDDFFNHFFGAPPNRRRAPSQSQLSQGSGFIVSPEGHILTNYHVVRGADKITVSLHDGMKRDLSATFVGGDEKTDTAMIKIDDPSLNHFSYLELGNSDEVEVGDWVLAVGSPFQLEATVTAGIISAKGRQNLQINDLEDFLQTDAAINPGNSGGPLIDLDGRVIGMNTAIVSRSGGYMGIGFAIPSNMLINIKEQLMATGSVSRGYLGVSLQPIDRDLAAAFNLRDTDGALVADVIEGSPAAHGGIQQGDIITHVNRQEVKNPTALRNAIMAYKPDEKISFTLNRNGKIMTVSVVLGMQGQSIYSSNATASKHLGISVDNLTKEHIESYRLHPTDKGVIIVEVKPHSAAARIGLRPGFIIMAVNHKEVKNVKDFNDALNNTKENEPILLLVKQGSAVRFYSIRIGK